MHNQRSFSPLGVTSRDMIDVGPVPTITNEQRAKAWALLNARGALDLADVLGLANEETAR